MSRQEEIYELLKSLLGKSVNAIGNNQYSSDQIAIVASSRRLLEESKKIQTYIEELDELESALHNH